jgi:hypothetical protein
MKVPAASDRPEDGWRHELTDLAILRIPRRVTAALDLADTAIVDGIKLRRHGDARITVEGRGPRPGWLA